jgi:hypothetical protein
LSALLPILVMVLAQAEKGNSLGSEPHRGEIRGKRAAVRLDGGSVDPTSRWNTGNARYARHAMMGEPKAQPARSSDRSAQRRTAIKSDQQD